MKKRTREQQHELVAEWKKNGETAAMYCERRGISRSTLHRWNREVASWSKEGISFVPVVVSDVRNAHRQEPCRIHVGGLCIIECGEDTSPLAVELAL
jgi:hypothetical protein